MEERAHRFSGVDAIMPGSIPQTSILPKELMLQMIETKQAMNFSNLAFIPYCMECRVPLDWVYYSNTLFICPHCNKEWIKGEGWKK